MANEKRRPKRYPKRLTVRFGDGEKLDRMGFTTDISVSGLFVVAPVMAPPIDSRIHLQIMLDGGKFVYLEGIVRRHRTPPRELAAMEHKGFGVRFVTPDELLGEMVPKALPTEREVVPDTSQVNVPQLPHDKHEEKREGEYEVPFASAADLKAAWDRELKLGGIFVKASWPVSPQSDVLLVFVLPFANRRVDVRSKVLAITPTGVAFGFDRAKLQAEIAAFLV